MKTFSLLCEVQYDHQYAYVYSVFITVGLMAHWSSAGLYARALFFLSVCVYGCKCTIFPAF